MTTVAPAKLLRDLRKTFRETLTAISAMHDAVQIKPSGDEVILPDGETSDTASFVCKPVVCYLPERATSSTASIYVVFTGLLTLAREVPLVHPATTSYATNFGYFKMGAAGVTHALGGHFDYAASDFAHPRAHLQLKSQAHLWSNAGTHFRSASSAEIERDPMLEVPSRVRTPSAQMDFLSFMIQIAADHLVDGKSGRAARRSFLRLTKSCVPFGSYAVPPAHDGRECHRACHWYPHD